VTEARTRSVIPWLLIAVAALIVYGSLYPFNFKPDAIEGGVVQAIRELSWARAGRGDRISNVLLYLPLGFCLFLWLNSRFKHHASIPIAALTGTALSLSIEIAQVYVPGRVSSLTDLTLNSAGTVLGAAGGLIWNMLSRLMHHPAHIEKSTADPGAVVLILLWLASRFVPFVPQLDLGKLKAALHPLFAPKFDAVSVFVYLTCWLVVHQALAATTSRSRRLDRLLLLIAAVLLGSLLLAGQTFVPAELVALLLLLPMLVLMHRLKPRPRRAALALAVLVVLILSALAPFDFEAPAGRFDFWPFMAWLRADLLLSLRTSDWAGLLGKMFLFGALIWTLRRSGTTTRFAGTCGFAVVLVSEILQLWLPRQNASIADPLLAAAMGWLMHRLHRHTRSQPFGRGAISQDERSR
jgi:VanZ family protein